MNFWVRLLQVNFTDNKRSAAIANVQWEFGWAIFASPSLGEVLTFTYELHQSFHVKSINFHLCKKFGQDISQQRHPPKRKPGGPVYPNFWKREKTLIVEVRCCSLNVTETAHLQVRPRSVAVAKFKFGAFCKFRIGNKCFFITATILF